MTLKEIHELAIKYPDYQEFLKQMIIKTKHPEKTTPTQFERSVNITLGNKTQLETD